MDEWLFRKTAFPMLIIPAIDLRHGRCVRLTQGRKADVTVYDENPVAVAQSFADAGAEMIHVVDLDGAFQGGESRNRAVVAKIVEAVDDETINARGLRLSYVPLHEVPIVADLPRGRSRHLQALRMEDDPVGGNDVGLLLQDEHNRPSGRHDRERLFRRVEYE